MLRHGAALDSEVPMRLLYSSRSLGDVIYREELMRLAERGRVDVRLTLTREWPDGWDGLRGRIDGALLDEVSWPPPQRPLIYICGPSGFVEAASQTLVQRGHDPSRIRTERFGPSGR
jgi:ferredoxin-NADP reductase